MNQETREGLAYLLREMERELTKEQQRNESLRLDLNASDVALDDLYRRRAAITDDLHR